MAKSAHAATAAAIKQELKAIGIKASVKSSSFSMGNSVDVNVTDLTPAQLKTVEGLVKKYQYGHFNGMEDLYECSNRRDDIPQAKYVSVHHTISDEYRKELLNKVNAYYGLNVSFEDLQSNPWGIEFNSSFGARDIHNEIYQLSTGAIDYDGFEQAWKREEEVKEIVVAAGIDWYSREVAVYFYRDLREWLVSCSFTNNRTTIADDYTETSKDIAHKIIVEYFRLFAEYKVEKHEQDIIDAENKREIIPVSVRHVDIKTVVYFPACNKQNDLEDNDQAIIEGPHKNKTVIKKIITVCNDDYLILSRSLLVDREYMYSKIGGAQIEDKYLEGIKEQTNEYYQAWRDHGETLCIKILNSETMAEFFVNTEGYDYARYVGRSAEWYAEQTTNNILKMFI